ncbi:hypothetical protein P3J6_121091 [Pseudoalteromonas sp. 3J6]|nr:hypothetical protein P3J6_121091 [Pseudoalteromonas sp. 3J6]
MNNIVTLTFYYLRLNFKKTYVIFKSTSIVLTVVIRASVKLSKF